MPKYKLNHNIHEQTCLSYYLVNPHRFSVHSIDYTYILYHLIVYIILCKTQKFQLLRLTKLAPVEVGREQNCTDKTLSNLSIFLKRGGHTHSRLFHDL